MSRLLLVEGISCEPTAELDFGWRRRKQLGTIALQDAG